MFDCHLIAGFRLYILGFIIWYELEYKVVSTMLPGTLKLPGNVFLAWIVLLPRILKNARMRVQLF